MRHNIIQGNANFDHYAVGVNSQEESVICQVQENGNQSRVSLSPEEAVHLALLLLNQVKKIKESMLK